MLSSVGETGAAAIWHRVKARLGRVAVVEAGRRLLPTGTISIFGLHAASLILLMLGSIPVARFLGPAQKGVVNLFTLLTGLITEFGLFGLNSGLLFQLGNRRIPLARVHTAALQACLVLGGLTLVVVIGLRPLLSRAFEGLPPGFLLVAAAMTPLLLYRGMWSSLMTGVERVVQVYRVNLVFSGASVAGLILLYGAGYLTATTVIWLSILLVAGYCLYGFAALGAVHQFRFEPGSASLKEALRYGAVVYVGVVFNFLHSRGDQILVNYFQGSRGLGIYTVSVASAEMLWLLDYAMMHTSVLRISSLEPAASWRYTCSVFRTTVLLLAGAAVALGAAAPVVVEGLYGAQFREAVLPLILLLPGIVAWGAGRILSQFISYNAGRPSLTSGAAAMGCAVNLLANLYAMPRWGLAGAAAASSVSYLATMAFVAITFARLGRRLGGPKWV